ncbi:MAG: hypothetical protein HGB10_07675 [Coriobacteriia bacterium]|nr:hypothetical protein [Coriobacteriia bacterium]
MTQEPTRTSTVRHIGVGSIVAIAIGALLLGSLAFAPVRAVASQFLGIFRIQRMQTISVTQADLEQISKVMSEGDGTVSLESLGDVTVKGGTGEPVEATMEDAQAAVDFDLRSLAAGEGTPTIALQPAMTVTFKLHVDKANELLESYGATNLFPKSMDGKEFMVHMPATVVMAYGEDVTSVESGQVDPDKGTATDAALYRDPNLGLILAQTRGPQLTVPPGVDPLALRDVLLGLPFLPESIRSQLANVQDWQNTLLIPNVEGTTREIAVGGKPGVVISPQAGAAGMEGEQIAPEETPVVVMWNDDGVMRAIGGLGGEQRILSMAESLTR